jgi:hypothetical protein
VFGDDVMVLIRKVSILDDKGDTKEQRAYEPELPDPFDVEIWTHEYDAMGNWIVERNYAPAKKGSKLPGKLLRTHRRTITYYP